MYSVCLASKPVPHTDLLQHGTTIQLVLHALCFVAHSKSCLRCIEHCIVLTLDTEVIASSTEALDLSAR